MTAAVVNPWRVIHHQSRSDDLLTQTENHVMHLNLCKAKYKPYMIVPYSTYLPKHGSLLWSSITEETKISKKEACISAFMTTSKEEVWRMYQEQMPGWALCVQGIPRHPTDIQNSDMSIWHYFTMINKLVCERDDNNKHRYISMWPIYKESTTNHSPRKYSNDRLLQWS